MPANEERPAACDAVISPCVCWRAFCQHKSKEKGRRSALLTAIGGTPYPILSMMAVANALVGTSVAPSIWRAKS